MDINLIRRSNLMLLLQQDLDGTFSTPHDAVIGQFAERLDLPLDTFEALQSGTREFGEDLARHIEKRLSLAEGWLDQDNIAYPGDQDADHRRQRLDNLYREAPPVVREALMEKEETSQQATDKRAGPPNVAASD